MTMMTQSDKMKIQQRYGSLDDGSNHDELKLQPQEYYRGSANCTVASSATDSESSFLLPISGGGSGSDAVVTTTKSGPLSYSDSDDDNCDNNCDINSNNTYYCSINDNDYNNSSSSSNNYNNNNHQRKPTNPEHNQSRNSAAADMRLSVLSNFSTAYNVLCISLALDILSNIHPEMTVDDTSACSSALFAGMILGQLVGGALGDILGRHVAMTVVMLLQVLASLLSCLSTDIHIESIGIEFSIFQVLACCRFVLGIGCGGIYPLSATLTAESSNNDTDAANSTDGSENNHHHNKAKSGAMAFSFQGVGYLAVPINCYILVKLFGESSDVAWRLLLGFGAVPGILLTVIRVYHNVRRQAVPKRLAMKDLNRVHAKRAPSVIEAIRNEDQLVRKLLGTAGCWLVFDIVFYGNTLFQPVVLDYAFGSDDETAADTARDSALISIMALPGYFTSVWMIGRQSPRYIQMQGFAIMAILFALIAAFFHQLSDNRVMLLVVYGATFFFSNYGPNTTTFMLPSMTYSKNCRSTLNGICAACGKVGALTGSIVFGQALEMYGQSFVFTCCAILSVVGCVLTEFCVQPQPSSEESSLKTQQQQQLPITTVALKDDPTAIKPIKIPSAYSLPSLFDYHERIIIQEQNNTDPEIS